MKKHNILIIIAIIALATIVTMALPMSPDRLMKKLETRFVYDPGASSDDINSADRTYYYYDHDKGGYYSKYSRNYYPFSQADLAHYLDKGRDPNAKVAVKNGGIFEFNPNFKELSLLYALAYDNQMVKMLLDAGADPNVTGDPWLEYTPLHLATTPEIAQYLISAGADLNAKNKSGRSPLHIIGSFYHSYNYSIFGKETRSLNRLYTLRFKNSGAHIIDAIKVLLENGADINATDDKSKTPLHFTNEPEIVQLLIDNGADINHLDENEATPLVYMTNERSIDILLSHKPNLDRNLFAVISNINLTNLDSQVYKIRELLKASANPNYDNDTGRSMLERVDDFYRGYNYSLAEDQSMQMIVIDALLQEYGGKPAK